MQNTLSNSHFFSTGDMASPERNHQPYGQDWSNESSFSSANTSPQATKSQASPSSAKQVNTSSARTRRVNFIPNSASENGEIGSKGRQKGQIRHNTNGALEHFLEQYRTWVPAVHHNDIRETLIKEAAKQGQYDVVRSIGRDRFDVTSFLPAHKTWGGEREDWPEVLVQGRHVYKNPKVDWSQPVPLWYHDGCLVLDHDNDPMRDLPDTLPAACSSRMKAWELLAIYESDPRISLADIRGRMPPFITLASGEQKPLIRTNALSMRMNRFRSTADISPDLKRPRSAESGSQSPQDFADDGSFSTPEDAQKIQEPALHQYTNKRRVDTAADSERNSYITGSPTKRARTHRLQRTSTTSNDPSPKLIGSQSFSPPQYNKGPARPSEFVPLEKTSTQTFFQSPAQLEAFAAGMRFAQKKMFQERFNTPRACDTNVGWTSLSTPVPGYNTQENIGLEDPFWDGPSQASANINPIPFMQQNATPNTGSIFAHASSAESYMTTPAAMKAPDTVLAQNENVSEDLADFLANLDREYGNNSNEVPIYSQEQTTSFGQMENAWLPHEASFTYPGLAQDWTTSEGLTDFPVSVPAPGGQHDDGTLIYEIEHAWPLEQAAFSLDELAGLETTFPAMGGPGIDQLPIYENAPGYAEDRVGPMTTEPDKTGSDQEMDLFLGVPPIVGIDDNGGAVFADGFRFRPEELVPF